MTNEIINKMIEEIKFWIELSVEEYHNNGRSDWYNRTIDRIHGMISMLQIASGKKYYFDENGVHERG